MAIVYKFGNYLRVAPIFYS